MQQRKQISYGNKRKRNKNKTAIMEILYYLVAIGSLILAIFQLICVVEAFKIALSYA